MRKVLRPVGAVLGLGLVFWVVAGVVVWNRNSFAAPNLPPRSSPPANNSYATYTGAVRSVQGAREIATLFREDAPSRSELAAVLQRNASVLSSLRDAGKQMSVVTDLEPGLDFVPAIDFPNVTRLLMLDARQRLDTSPKTALEPMLDGVRFSEGVMRGGAMLHVLTAYMAYAPIFQGFPRITSRLPAETCRSGADALRKVIGEQASLDEIVKNEHGVRFRQLTSTFPRPGSVFRLEIPWTDAHRREFALKPKAPAVDGLNRYFAAWQSQTGKPIREVAPPDSPAELQGILNDDSMGPEEMGRRFLQFYWRDARLRLVYTALRLEQWKKEKGRYPADLREMWSDPLYKDPFSGELLIYRLQDGGYTLYSVGPNGKDDGGMSMNEAKLSPGREGDLPLTPTFGRR